MSTMTVQPIEVVRGTRDCVLLKRLFTVDDYHRMAEVGLLAEDERTELLDGEVVFKMPIGSRHAACVKRLIQILVTRLIGRAIVGAQDPVRLGPFSEPEPDISVLRPRLDTYGQSHPEPDDVLFLIEVADSSLNLDRQVKAPLYAASGIAELWIVDLTSDTIDVFRDPGPEGYLSIERHARGDVLAPEAFPDLTLSADDILGPPLTTQ